MTTRSKRRTGIVRYLGNIVDETKDLVDDLLDRGRDLEHDLRDTARKAFDYEDDDEDDSVRRELAALRCALTSLTAKVDELAGRKSEPAQPNQQD